MTKQPTSFRLSDLTTRQLAELISSTGLTQSEVMSHAIERMYQQEIKTMKEIKVGEVNDLHLFAIEADGRYYPMKPMDRIFERADAKIYYDSGIYPGITLDELPQYICDKAKDIM